MNRQRGHKNREDLAGEHPFGDTGQIILLVIFMIVWVFDSFILHITTFPARYVSLLLRIPVGLFLLVAAGYFAKEGMRVVFDEERAEPAVIRAGVFARVRHPVYLGSILVYLGMVVFTLSVFSAGVCVVIMIFYHYISRHEEQLLLAKFGIEYEEYMKSVPMWIPRI
jgi:protein-S-isoprenylcysteine O-methyltransferase Ste14